IHEAIDHGVRQTSITSSFKGDDFRMKSAKMELHKQGDFVEDFMVMVTVEEEEVGSHVELVLIVGPQSITNESAKTYCSAH
ncbi:hypothetical protein KI387_036343, partial [Taxus chinensis]